MLIICFVITGVYRDSKSYSMYVDIGQVSEFQSITDHSNSVEFGASVTLSRLVDYLMQKSNQSVTFEPIVSHVKHVASKPIRNVGCSFVIICIGFLKNLICKKGALRKEKPHKELETAKIIGGGLCIKGRWGIQEL